MPRTALLKTLALGAALGLPFVVGGCSMMGDTGSSRMSDTGSASTVSRDSQGAGAISGAVSTPGGATVGTPGDKNPPPKT